MSSPAKTIHLEREAVSQSSERRYELDWLRVLIIVSLIPFHVIGLFAIAINTYVAGGPTNALIDLFSNFFGLWPMSLLFLVAGASTWFALGRRSPPQYIRERVLRLCVPFLFATLAIIPIQVYAVLNAYPELINLNIVPSSGIHGGESFFEFYPPYLQGYAYFLTHFSSMREIVFWGHIWFIPRLLLYALATLPVLLWLRSAPNRRFITRLGEMFSWPGATLLFGVVIALPRILAAALYRLDLAISRDANWDTYMLWAQLFVFMMCFLLGYLFYASPRMLEAIRRNGPVALSLGIFTYFLLETPVGHFASVTEFTPAGVLITLLRAESEWMLVAGVLGLGLQFFVASNGMLQYLNEAAYPLYVLHMPILILVGLFLLTLNLPSVVLFTAIVAATLALTFGLYEFAIKRVGVLRMLFGLKAKRTASG